jgi:outer membrane lipoprotein-sorting protein
MLVFIAAAVPLAASTRRPAMSAELQQVLEHFDRVQESIRTLSAEFTETVSSALLKEDVVGRGKVYLTKPDAVRWEYTLPEEMRFVIANDEYTGYFPLRKRAERRDIHRWSEQLFRFLGLGQASDELSRFYTITLVDGDAGIPGTHVLRLDPIKKRVRKRMDEVRFWIDAESFLPRRVEYKAQNGSTRRIDFTSMDVNPQLAASLYVVELPPGTDVTKGFSALSGLSVPD